MRSNFSSSLVYFYFFSESFFLIYNHFSRFFIQFHSTLSEQVVVSSTFDSVVGILHVI